jgi:hypothetical protein
MAKTAKKPAKKAAPKAKPAAKKPATAKAKPKTKAVAKPKPKPAAPPKPAPIDWAATLRSGEDGVKKWNNLGHLERQKVSFAGADLTGADLTMAKLADADLRGADLTGSLLNNIALEYSTFDEKTKWPTGFEIADTLKWKGKGADPRKAQAVQPAAAPAPAPVDFGGFMNRLKQVTDPAKLDKATSMLKAEKFRLYAKVQPDHLVGVVKSQTNPDLVYSCRIGSDGKYSCGTQNLNICGGLRGSPCKHLLVLIVGLSKAGELDATKAHDWTQASRGKKPELDKDAMTATFLQYKGAEAGEIDWRPTETIPEDFYAM